LDCSKHKKNKKLSFTRHFSNTY